MNQCFWRWRSSTWKHTAGEEDDVTAGRSLHTLSESDCHVGCCHSNSYPRVSLFEYKLSVCGDWMRLYIKRDNRNNRAAPCRRRPPIPRVTSPGSFPTIPSSSDLTVLSPFLCSGEKFQLKQQSVVLEHLGSAVQWIQHTSTSLLVPVSWERLISWPLRTWRVELDAADAHRGEGKLTPECLGGNQTDGFKKHELFHKLLQGA